MRSLAFLFSSLSSSLPPFFLDSRLSVTAPPAAAALLLGSYPQYGCFCSHPFTSSPPLLTSSHPLCLLTPTMLPHGFSPPPPPHHPHPPSRSRKHKNGPKKQPQRGLGVAQLEKLRLEEQRKQQQQVACLDSLHHNLPPLSDAFYIPSHHQLHQQLRLSHSLKAGSFHVITAPSGCTTIQFQQQKQQRQLPVGVSLAPCDQLSFDQNGVNNSFLPFPSVTLAGASRQSLCIDIMQHAGTEENELCSPSLSQVQDLCSPRSGMSSTISLSEQSVSRQSPICDNAKTLISDDLLGANVPLDSPTFLTNQAESRVGPMQIQQTGSKWETLQGSANKPVNIFSPIKEWSKEEEMQSSNEPQKLQNQGAPLSFTDLRLLNRSLGPSTHRHKLGPSTHPHNQPRNREEASVTTTSFAPAESLELSSFQKICSDQGWSLSDQVSGRKRPWTSMQEIARNSVDLQGMFLNKLMGESRPKLEEQDMPADVRTVVVRMPEASTSTSIYRSSAALRNSSYETSTKTDLFPSTISEMRDCFPAFSNRSPSGFGGISKNLTLLEVCPLLCKSRTDCFSAASDAASTVNCKKDYGVIAKMESNFLTLELSSSLCGMHEQPMVHNGRKGQHQSSCKIGTMGEIQMHHDGAAERTQYSCAELENGVESKMRQPWMLSGDRYGLSERNYPSKAMNQFQRSEAKKRQQQEEEREEKAITCLDLNLKLSL